jgi:nucleotide-binding universal stress UspA family protein
MLQNRFKKILVALDGSMHSRKGLNEAISLARQTNGTITGIFVSPVLSIGEGGITLTYRQILLKKSRKFMSEAKIAAAIQGVEFDGKILKSNDICNTIINFARSNKLDIIIIGARGQTSSSPKSQFLGSVSNMIVNTCSLPVLLVR